MALKNSFNVTEHGELTEKLLLNNADGAPEFASNGKQAVIELRNSQSKKFKSIRFKATQAYNTMIRKGQVDTIERETARDINMLSAAFVGWENLEIEEGVPLEFTPENVQMILTEYPHIRQDVNDFISNLNEFVKKTTLSA